MSNISVPSSFNLQWDSSSTIIGIPKGYYLRFDTQNPPILIVDTKALSTYSILRNSLIRDTTYYWQVVPYGYDDLRASSCPIWSFSTIPTNPTIISTTGGGTTAGQFISSSTIRSTFISVTSQGNIQESSEKTNKGAIAAAGIF